MMEYSDVYLIQLLLTVGVIYLLWMKSLWEDLEEDNAVFYPDGLGKCLQETYTIDDDSSRVKCISCPTCPTGEEPSPPCGSTLVRKATGECLPCKTGTYSAKADIAACKVCTDCGSREVTSSCTAERNTECKECPFGHYEDDTTHICKHCSSCCEKHSAAQMTCMTSKTCKENCSQSTRIEGKYLSPIFNRLVAKVINSSYSTNAVSNPTRRQKGSQDMPERLENRISTDSKESNTERAKRDVYLSVASLDYYKDTSDRKTNNAMPDAPMDEDTDWKEIDDWHLLQIPDSSNDEQKTSDLPRMEREKESYSTNGVVKEDQLVSTTFKPRVPAPPTPDTNIGRMLPHTPENSKTSKMINSNGALKENQVVSATLQPTVPAPTAPESNIGQLMLPTPIPVKSTAATEQSSVINTNSFLSSFSGTFVAFLLVGCIVLIIYIVHRRCAHKRARGYREISGTEIPGEEQIGDDQLDENWNEDEMDSLTNETTVEFSDQNNTTQIEEDLNLSEIPQDLEDVLVMKLDVSHGRPESKVYAWQKVGNAAGISRHELKFFHNEYLRQNGSPTKLLLEKLGSQGKTISYLLDVLQTPRMQLDSVAASIRHRVTRV